MYLEHAHPVFLTKLVVLVYKWFAVESQRSISFIKLKQYYFSFRYIFNDVVLSSTFTLTGGEEVKKYSCKQCEYNTSRKYRFKRHVDALHNGVKYPCDQCEFKASIKSYLRIHKLSVHDGLYL